MVFVLSAPQGTHYNTDVIYLLSELRIKKGVRPLWNADLSLHQLGSRPAVFIPRWTTQRCILYKMCAACGAQNAVRTIRPAKVECWCLSKYI